jgi:hypothetical protein
LDLRLSNFKTLLRGLANTAVAQACPTLATKSATLAARPQQPAGIKGRGIIPGRPASHGFYFDWLRFKLDIESIG